jgi:hypothetical protein
MLPALRREIRIVRAINRVGHDAQCSQCDECRPEPLIVRPHETVCDRCDLIRRGLPPVEDHHPAGRANDPFTVSLDANDHKVVTAMQEDWPIGVRSNVTQDPLVKLAAIILGLIDTSPYVSRELLLPFIRNYMKGTPEMLLSLNRRIRMQHGDEWWK